MFKTGSVLGREAWIGFALWMISMRTSMHAFISARWGPEPGLRNLGANVECRASSTEFLRTASFSRTFQDL
jgi:hypothetical protein